MKQFLLVFAATALCGAAIAQKKKNNNLAYAITGVEKGHSGWTEVRLVDVTTGEEVKTIYQRSREPEILNARTGKPVVKKDATINENQTAVNSLNALKATAPVAASGGTRVYTFEGKNVTVNKDVIIIKDMVGTKDLAPNVNIIKDGKNQTYTIIRKVARKMSYDAPFATTSAACAFDAKHDRLYYTPMNINQLRYIDLKSGKIYYFEDETFGVVSGMGDVQNQITRMVIGADKNGYALSNNAEHLIRFTTGKKPQITDLGAITDDPANGKYSVKSGGNYGGDIIADKNNNLYLIAANRRVFKIDIETRVATYMGSIQGLPAGFSTNGAVVEEGSKVIVTSSSSTEGYYRFDLNTLQAEKASSSSSVFNASDLANGNLADVKKKKDEPKEEIVIKEEPKKDVPKDVVVTETPVEKPTENAIAEKKAPQGTLRGSMTVFPNPVTTSLVKLSLTDLAPGKYEVQLFDLNGKLVASNNLNLNYRQQVEDFQLPKTLSKGSYMVKLVSKANNLALTSPIIVQ